MDVARREPERREEAFEQFNVIVVQK